MQLWNVKKIYLVVDGFGKRQCKRGSCLKGAVRWWSDRGEVKAILETKACQQAQVSGKKDQQANVNRLLSSSVMLKGFQGDSQESILGLFFPSLPLRKGYCSCQHYTFLLPRGRMRTLQVFVPCFYILSLLPLSSWFILDDAFVCHLKGTALSRRGVCRFQL